MGLLGAALNPLSPFVDFKKSRDAKEQRRRAVEEARLRQEKLGRMLQARQQRMGMLDYQPTYVGDLYKYQKTIAPAETAYLASVMAGNSPNSTSPWEAKGTQAVKDYEFQKTHGDTLAGLIQQGDQGRAEQSYQPKSPGKVDTSPITAEGEDVDGIYRPNGPSGKAVR